MVHSIPFRPLPGKPRLLAMFHCTRRGAISSRSPMNADYIAYLNSDEWKTLRRSAIARAGRHCQLCNATGYLQVHHRSYARIRTPEEIEDLVALCRHCHVVISEHLGHKPKPIPKKAKKKHHKRIHPFRKQSPEEEAGQLLKYAALRERERQQAKRYARTDR